MATNYIHAGDVMDYTAGADIDSGDVVVAGVTLGVALTDIANTKVGSVAIEGVFELTKEAGVSGKQIAQGATVYWKADPGQIQNAVGDPALPVAGVAMKAAATAATTVLVKINA